MKEKNKEEKKEKRAQRGTPETAQKMIFYIRAQSGNRDEIEAKKKSDFEQSTKKKKKKEKKTKKNERKCKQNKRK